MPNRVHPIYVALDSHQYAKAVKLASALPQAHVLGRSLLAYAQYKNGQTNTALSTIHALLGWNVIGTEKDLDICLSLDKVPERVDWTVSANLIPSNSCPIEFADETTLETIAITLQGLNRYEMVYQLYAWAGHFHNNIRLFTLLKQYTAGLQILVRSTNNDSILASMQTLTMQMARLSPHYTSWAARTALWQWKFSREDEKSMRHEMLPRLAESLAHKMVQRNECTIEDCLLAIETFKAQKKWTELLDILPTFTKLTSVQNLELQAMCWENLEIWDRAQGVYEQLLEKHPGQWSYWKSLIFSGVKAGGSENARKITTECLNRLQGCRQTRSIALASLELALRDLDGTKNSIDNMQDSITSYGEKFAQDAPCAFLDLEKYMNNFLQVATEQQVLSMFQWADNMRILSLQEKGGDDRKKLRLSIFSLQTMQKLLMSLPEGNMPQWTDIAESWQSFPTTVGVQKENQPSDELLLLAIDELLREKTPTIQSYVAAATLLEMGLRHSPFSPNLKLRLIGIYKSLQASDRCWVLFRELGIKHIQLDSCSYFILPILLEGGLYQEALTVANETLKFHITTLSDTSDFVARALDNGIWSKADEFLCFQRNRMNLSLCLLESKGITMDCAPLMGGDVGHAHGVVGGDDDIIRATRIMKEAHTWTGAPSIISLKMSELESLSDNRDLSILPRCVTVESQEELIRNSIRRKFYHGVLVRAVAVLEVSKPPKKGKLIKTSEILRLRCESLLNVIKVGEAQPVSQWEETSSLLVKVIVLINSGLPSTDGESDTLTSRENGAVALLESAISCMSNHSIDLTMSKVGKLISDHLVSVIALLKMTADVFSRFGWGKRKKRRSVTTLAQLAGALQSHIIHMIAVTKSYESWDKVEVFDDFLNHDVWNLVCEEVKESRKKSSNRIMNILLTFSSELSTFHQED
jgi:tetratricopeptide (TPR) repeat protein